MAAAAISASPSFLCSSPSSSIATTHRLVSPRRGVLTPANGLFSTSAPSLLFRPRGRGSSSCAYDVCPIIAEGKDVASPSCAPPSGFCLCGGCGRRRLLGGISSSSLAGILGPPSATGGNGGTPIVPPEERSKVAHPSRPGWYKELYARAMDQFMKSYEAEIAGYKEELFAHLTGENNKILELGVGTGPNLKYYANDVSVDVIGVDPNERMEKYARATAVAVGLPSTHFNFIQGFAEALPIRDDSMDVVIGTLVLCSVQDVDATLREVKRVLKPGGLYIFIEHVAAQDGSLPRLLQGVLDPLQQFISDGCHLTRETGKDISRAGFSDVDINTASISIAPIFNPHIYGIARK